jgi:hypothetical protein
MTATGILLPATALIGWTLLVLLLLPWRRFRAAAARRVRIADFRLGESPNVPADVSLPNRNWMNLLEAPVLFYAISVMLFATQLADRADVLLAWTYVGLRVTHSLVHIGYNDVMHRLAVFATSNVVLLVLWARLAWRLAGAT